MIRGTRVTCLKPLGAGVMIDDKGCDMNGDIIEIDAKNTIEAFEDEMIIIDRTKIEHSVQCESVGMLLDTDNKIYNMTTGMEFVKSVNDHVHCFASQGQYLYAASNRKLDVYNHKIVQACIPFQHCVIQCFAHKQHVFVISDKTAHRYEQGKVDIDQDKVVELPHEATTACMSREGILIGCVGGHILYIPYQEWEVSVLESPHHKHIRKISSFGSSMMAASMDYTVSIWDLPLRGEPVHISTLEENAIDVLVLDNFFVTCSINHWLYIWNDEQKCVLSWQVNNMTTMWPGSLGQSLIIAYPKQVVTYQLKPNMWQLHWNERFVHWASLPHVCLLDKLIIYPCIEETILRTAYLWCASCWIHCPKETPLCYFFEHQSICNVFLNTMETFIYESWESSKTREKSLQWLHHKIHGTMELDVATNFYKKVVDTIGKRISSNCVYNYNVAHTLRQLLLDYGETWNHIRIITWCCVHARQPIIRSILHVVLRRYPETARVILQVAPTPDLFLCIPATIREELYNCKWIAFFIEGFLRPSMPIREEHKLIFDEVVQACKHPEMFELGIDAPLPGCGRWVTGETKMIKPSLVGQWAKILIESMTRSWQTIKILSVTMSSPRSFSGIMCFDDDNEPLTITMTDGKQEWALWETNKELRFHTPLDCALALCADIWNFSSAWVICLTTPLPGDTVRCPELNIDGVVSSVTPMNKVYLTNGETLDIDHVGIEIYLDPVKYRVEPFDRHELYYNCRKAILQWGSLKQSCVFSFEYMKPLLFYDTTHVLDEIEFEGCTAHAVYENKIWIGQRTGKIVKCLEHNLKITQLYCGHTQPVRCLTLCDEFTLVSGSDDCDIRVWNTTTAECRYHLREHTCSIASLIHIKDYIVWSLSTNGHICTWDVYRGLRESIISFSNVTPRDHPGPWLEQHNSTLMKLRYNGKMMVYSMSQPTMKRRGPSMDISIPEEIVTARRFDDIGWCVATKEACYINNERIAHKHVCVFAYANKTLYTGTTNGNVYIWNNRRPVEYASVWTSAIRAIIPIVNTTFCWVFESLIDSATLISLSLNNASDACRILNISKHWSLAWSNKLHKNAKTLIQPVCTAACWSDIDSVVQQGIDTINSFTEDYEYRKQWCTSSVFRLLNDTRAIAPTKVYDIMQRLVTFTGPRPFCCICQTNDALPFCRLKTCDHIFHRECIESYVRAHPDFVSECQHEWALSPNLTCPQCRTEFPQKNFQVLLSPTSSTSGSPKSSQL